MKLGATARLILAIGIFAVAVVSLYRINLEHVSERQSVETQLSTMQGLVPMLVSDRHDLDSRLTQLNSDLDQASSRLAQAKAVYPESVQSIEYDQTLFRMANDHDLEIVRLTASEPFEEEAEDVTYLVTPFQIEVEPVEPPPETEEEFIEYVRETIADMVDFVYTINAGEEFTTASAGLVNIVVPEPPGGAEEEEGEEEEIEEMLATIRLGIYGYEGE